MFKELLVVSSDLEKELAHFSWGSTVLAFDPDYKNKIKGTVIFDVNGEHVKHDIDLEVELVLGTGKVICTTPFCSFLIIRKPYKNYAIYKAVTLDDLNKGNFSEQYFLPLDSKLKDIVNFLHHDMFSWQVTPPVGDGFTIPDEMVNLTNLQGCRYYGLSERMRERSIESRSAAPAFILHDGKNIVEAADKELKARKEAFGKSEGLLRSKIEMDQLYPSTGVKVVSRFEPGIVFATINDAIEFHKSDLGKDENDDENVIILRRQMDEIFKANGSIWNAESISKLKDLLDSMHYNPLTEGTITIEHGTFDLVDELQRCDSNVKLSIRSRHPRDSNNSETRFAQMVVGAPLTEELAKMPNIIDIGLMVPHPYDVIAKGRQSTPDVFYDTEGTIDVKKWSGSIVLTTKQKSRMTSRQIKKHAKKNK